MKSFILIAIIFFGLIGFLFFTNQGVDIKPPFEVGVLHPLDNFKGGATSTVLIVEYSDFECPACKNFYLIMKDLEKEFGNKITFVYRHFPLVGIHPNAEFASRAAEAAGKQGKFWEMHDMLFDKQEDWSKVNDVESVFSDYAKEIGISVDQFKIDWKSKEIKDLVRAQKEHSIKIGLQGTPTIFVNGKKIEMTSVEMFRLIINQELGK